MQQKDWPVIGDIDSIDADNAKAVVERADALLKAQDDGLRAMEARMSTLFGQSITLASAAVAATVTAFSALDTPNASTGPIWALPWIAQSLAALSVIWLGAVIVSALAMLSQSWTATGMQPHDLYNEIILTSPANSLRLAIARALQDAIDENTSRTARYSRRLACVVSLLAAGPFVGIALALWSTRPAWAPAIAGAMLLLGYAWLVRFVYHWGLALNQTATNRVDGATK
jgi:hypothetical protein